MAHSASPDAVASQARRLYTEELVKGLTPLVQAVIDAARNLLDKPSEHGQFQRRRDLMQGPDLGCAGLAPRHRGGLAPCLAQRRFGLKAR
jgi:hypothetical protein